MIILVTWDLGEITIELAFAQNQSDTEYVKHISVLWIFTSTKAIRGLFKVIHGRTYCVDS